jgi:carbonic anhydrase
MKLLSNGLKGWKKSWKGDLRASVTVAFIAIPLGLGIGLASGVPPLAAIIPCVVGGLLISWFSGGNLAVHSTPKMLIGVTAAGVLTLGGDDIFLGYQLFLAAVVFAGIIQFILGLLRLGIVGDLIPATVVKSLLAAVGVIIVVKQVPVLLGVDIQLKNIIELVLNFPKIVLQSNLAIAFIGLVSTAIMFLHPRVEFPVIKAIPGAVWVIIVAEIYSHVLGFEQGGSFNVFGVICQFDKSFLINLPKEITDAVVFPDFSLWKTGVFWNIVLAIVIVSSIEGILSAKAIDRLDPLKRKSNINKELRVIGLGTVASGMIGGLPVIPAIVATSVGVNHNGKSQLMDVFQAIFILLLIIVGGSQLELIPLAALSGILIHTGYKLFNPKEILNTYRIGWDQLIIFVSTLVVTLVTDMIYGLVVGIGITLISHVFRLKSLTKLFTILFRPNVVSYEEEDDKFLVSVKGYSNFLNYPRLKNTLDVIPYDATIIVDLSLVEFVDHSVLEHLAEYEETHIRHGGSFEIIGMDTHFSSTDHPLSVRFKSEGKKRNPKKQTLTSRQLKMQTLSSELQWGFDLSVKRYVNTFEKFHLFRYKLVDKVYNKLIGTLGTNSFTIQDIDFHEGEFQTRADRHTTAAIIGLNNPIPLFTIEKESLFDKVAALAGYDDIDFKKFKKFSDTFRLKGENEPLVREFFQPKLLRFLETELPFRLESTGSSLLILGKERLQSEAEIRKLIDFSKQLCAILDDLGS